MIWKTLFSGKAKTEQADAQQTTPPAPAETSAESFAEKADIAPKNALFTKHDCLFVAESQDDRPQIVADNTPQNSLWQKIRQTQKQFIGSWTQKKLSLEVLDDLEDSLIQADLGTALAMKLRESLEQERFNKEISEQELKQFLKQEMLKILTPVAQKMVIPESATKPHVVMFVGVNGTGKTTTIGKMAHHFQQYGKSVMLVAGDTFRAAATEQLVVWGQRNNVQVISGQQGADAANLIYNGYAQAQEQNIDILMVDTAGRLQNKNNLMQELLKMTRVLQKYQPDLPHEIILVLDATTGQNALQQAEIFRDMANISGIIMTKLDGSAKGGALVNVSYHLKLPIYAVGLGEKIDDVYPFNPEAFVNALLEIN